MRAEAIDILEGVSVLILWDVSIARVREGLAAVNR